MGKGWSGGLLLLVSVWLMWGSVPVVEAATEAPQEALEWANLARKVEELVIRGDLVSARDQLAVLSRRFSGADLSGKHLHVDAIHALSGTLLEMERQLNRVRPDETGLLRTARQLVIAFDAAAHPHQPLWKESYDTIRKHSEALLLPIRMQRREAYDTALERLEQEYRLIRPGLVVAKSPAVVSRMDSLMAFLKKAQDWKEIRYAADQWLALLQPLFFGTEKEVMAVVTGWDERVTWRFALWLGMLTATALTWASWNKYRQTVASGGTG
ncbi:sporulation protein YpjB [Staphylospora marina]|uniref:sporulation protein YpjB n=1 Tax=Staphylospora marina TaxID=2490858 RepID=UPI0013DDA2EB|nr:sporulation protein YpjB [Staphylospora marina]